MNFFPQNHLNNNPLPRPVRSSNAGINVKDIFNSSHPIYGTSGQVNQAFDEDDDGNSIRMTSRNQASWSQNQMSNNQRL